MTAAWWCCRICGQEFYESQGVYAHRANTGHNDAGLVTNHVGTGEGSTKAGRAAARALYEQIRDEANTAKEQA